MNPLQWWNGDAAVYIFLSASNAVETAHELSVARLHGTDEHDVASDLGPGEREGATLMKWALKPCTYTSAGGWWYNSEQVMFTVIDLLHYY